MNGMDISGNYRISIHIRSRTCEINLTQEETPLLKETSLESILKTISPTLLNKRYDEWKPYNDSFLGYIFEMVDEDLAARSRTQGKPYIRILGYKPIDLEKLSKTSGNTYDWAAFLTDNVDVLLFETDYTTEYWHDIAQTVRICSRSCELVFAVPDWGDIPINPGAFHPRIFLPSSEHDLKQMLVQYTMIAEHYINSNMRSDVDPTVLKRAGVHFFREK